jgi:4'-phosphopantetheinyl transferase
MATELLIYCCHLPAIDAELMQEYLPLLNAEEHQRFEAFRVEPARKSFLVSRALLRTTLAQRLKCSPDELQFRRDHNDKPQLATPASHWQFNLSHAGDWAVLALSSAGAIGIDVEFHERRNQLDGISNRFFSAAEHRYLSGLPEDFRRQRFFELWTLKEAYVKALGRGIATALAGTDIEYLNDTEILLSLSDAARCDGAVHCWHYALTPADSLALALIDDAGASVSAPRIFRSIPLRDGHEDHILRPSLTGHGRLA